MTPWQIAIETSCRQGSVALLRADETIRQITLDRESRTAQTLAPALQELLDLLRQHSGTLQWVSVGVGPGSFTGLRIAVASAKSLAYALGCPVAEVDTLSAMLRDARQQFPNHPAYDAVLNAYRGQVFWRRESTDGQALADSQVIDQAQWRAQLTTPSMILTGDVWGLPSAPPAAELPSHCQLTPAASWQPAASQIGALGWEIFQSEQTVDPFKVLPRYLRASAAEEKRKQSSPPTNN